jgi:type VI secretion system protein ImpE
MSAERLLREGKLDEAVKTLGNELRDNPGNIRSRTFLFELLCFRGDYDRASTHLKMLGSQSKDAGVGALLYEGALHAERLREAMFRTGDFPGSLSEGASKVSGTLNGKPFASLSDADPRIGARLEIFAGGDYLWIPLNQVASIEMKPPARLRDLLWSSAILQMGPGYQQRDLGEVLLPVLCPLSFQDSDDQVRLGRVTEWYRDEQGLEFPIGQKMLLVDGEEFPFLEIRKLEIGSQAAVGV